MLRTREGKLGAVALLGASALCVYVLVYPFWLVRYPPITDLPFHAANTSILRHYSDPEYHFRNQFYVDPLSAPYMLQYLVGAGLSLLMPIHVAVKVTCVLLLGCLPLGLSLLFRGLGKPRFMGLIALGLVYSTLTHWGFISHIAALGFFAGSVGAALMLFEGGSLRQCKLRTWLLGSMLLLTLFSHVYRYAFALVGVLLVAAVAKRSGRALREFKFFGLALLPSLVLFLVFWFRRDHVTGAQLLLTWAPTRVSELPTHVFGGFVASVGERERLDGWLWLFACLVLGVGNLVWRRRQSAPEHADTKALEPTPEDAPTPLAPLSAAALRRFRRDSHILVALICVGLFGLYLSLPLSWGSWFFVYPREALSVLFLLLALLPAMPKGALPRVALVGVLALTAGRQALLVAGQWLGFERLNQDFYAIQAKVPPHPRLLYLVFDHAGTYRSTTPFIHLPAWIQAETGGSLYFHFVRWGLYPIHYRPRGEDTPPSLPYMLEWHPESFRTIEHGAWFDTFLVRHRVDPAIVFQADPSIQLVAHEGEWWLYRRLD
ncbi:MAG: hypothetical protein KC492_17230 [Myxococcales bacterium]|nr:hypothetical protein [Myxococcales bacterium]